MALGNRDNKLISKSSVFKPNLPADKQRHISKSSVFKPKLATDKQRQ